MFEIYHAGDEPFEYMKEFYIGELEPEDIALVPKPRTPPSKEFLQYLASVTPWRLKGAVRGAHKSF